MRIVLLFEAISVSIILTLSLYVAIFHCIPNINLLEVI